MSIHFVASIFIHPHSELQSKRLFTTLIGQITVWFYFIDYVYSYFTGLVVPFLTEVEIKVSTFFYKTKYFILHSIRISVLNYKYPLNFIFC